MNNNTNWNNLFNDSNTNNEPNTKNINVQEIKNKIKPKYVITGIIVLLVLLLLTKRSSNKENINMDLMDILQKKVKC